jgi:hypothetical protein
MDTNTFPLMMISNSNETIYCESFKYLNGASVGLSFRNTKVLEILLFHPVPVGANQTRTSERNKWGR